MRYFSLLVIFFVAGCGSESQDGSAATEADGAGNTEGPRQYVVTLPNPCALISEDVAKRVLGLDEIMANPANSGGESLSPRCAYRDNQALGKVLSMVVVRTPWSVVNSTMSATDLRDLANLHYSQSNAPYELAETGPGAHRFVGTTEDSTTMFVMSGLGVPGGSYAPDNINAEAAFAVTLRDAAQSAEARLAAVGDLAAAYQASLQDSSQSR